MPAHVIRAGNRPSLRIADPEMAIVWKAVLASIDQLSP
jgi:hypothetical protein